MHRSLDGDYPKSISFYQVSIDKLRRFCQTSTDVNEKKRGNEMITMLERELQSTNEHERMIGDIHQNLSMLYARGTPGNDVRNENRVHPVPAYEPPTRDPDVFGPGIAPHAAAP